MNVQSICNRLVGHTVDRTRTISFQCSHVFDGAIAFVLLKAILWVLLVKLEHESVPRNLQIVRIRRKGRVYLMAKVFTQSTACAAKEPTEERYICPAELFQESIMQVIHSNKDIGIASVQVIPLWMDIPLHILTQI